MSRPTVRVLMFGVAFCLGLDSSACSSTRIVSGAEQLLDKSLDEFNALMNYDRAHPGKLDPVKIKKVRTEFPAAWAALDSYVGIARDQLRRGVQLTDFSGQETKLTELETLIVSMLAPASRTPSGGAK